MVGAAAAPPIPLWMEQRFGAAEAILSAHRDPQYVQAVLKPRLRRLLVYRLNGLLTCPWKTWTRRGWPRSSRRCSTLSNARKTLGSGPDFVIAGSGTQTSAMPYDV